MALIEATALTKSFRIPDSARNTVRQRVLGLFKPPTFRELRVLDKVDFSLSRGESLGVMGRNGSGKSTLLKVLTGIYQADAGTIVRRAPITPILELGLGWNPELDAVDNVLLIGTVMGLSLGEVRRSLDEILAFAGVESFANLKLQHYSSGMAARLAYAIAFHAIREVLVLDEIFAVGDAEFRLRCADRYKALHREGHSIVLVSHDANVIETFCTRAVLLEAGRVAADGSPKQVSAAYTALLGTDERSFTSLQTGQVSRGAHLTPVARVPPTVSVIIPCFNLGQYLDEAVTSVLKQTFGDFEVIVVDDGSTESETRRVLDNYRWPKTRVVSMTHSGLAAARNAGIQASIGRYLCFLDADDKLAASYFEKAVALLDNDASAAFVSSWLETFGEEQWLWQQERCDFPTLLVECTVSTSALVRREAVVAAGGFRRGLPAQGYEDWDLWISLVERGYRGVILPEPMLLYRRRSGSMSSVCCRDEVHVELMADLRRQHANSYHKYVYDVLVRLEERAAEVLRDNYSLQARLAQQLEPQLVERVMERDRLRDRVIHTRAMKPSDDDARVQEVERLRVALANASADAAALRASASWKVTAPLRAVGKQLWARQARAPRQEQA